MPSSTGDGKKREWSVPSRGGDSIARIMTRLSTIFPRTKRGVIETLNMDNAGENIVNAKEE
jgi:hypothetical protein